MSAEAHNHDHGHDEHEHHHKDTFITKYIFSIDHKMISKQYLITGIIMGVIGVGMSMLFRMQLAWPEESFKIFSFFLGERMAPGGVMNNETYLALVTIHGTIMVFFVLTAGLSGTFSNLLIPLQIGARDMASGFLNMISYWLFFLSSVCNGDIIICRIRSGFCRMDYLSTFKCFATIYVRFWSRDDFMVGFYGYFYRFIIIRFIELYRYGNQFKN